MFKTFSVLKKIFIGAKTFNALNFFPFIESTKSYKIAYLKGDIKGSINVALLAFPQGMAYAMIAGLDVYFGIVSAALATFAFAFFSKKNLISMGPTNATAIMLLVAFSSLGISENQKEEYLITLVLIVGLIITISAYFKVANLIKYVSTSVITGYITAAALLIIANQIPMVLGIDLNQEVYSFFDSLFLTWQNLAGIKYSTLSISIITLIAFFILNKKFSKLPNVAIVIILVSIFTYIFSDYLHGISFLKSIENKNVLSFGIPSFNLKSIEILFSTAIAISLLCVIEGISIGKEIAFKKREPINLDQTMYAIGMSNIICSFFSYCMPASGSLTRSSLNYNSGSKTIFSNLFCGLIIFLALYLLISFIQFVPKATLSVLIIIIGCSLINIRSIKIVTCTTKSDAIVFFITLFSGLYLPLTTAIYLGVGLSIVLFLKKVSNPKLTEYSYTEDGVLAESETNNEKIRKIPEISIVHVEGELFFGAAELFREQMQRIYEEPQLKIVILKMRNAHHMDASSVIALEELTKQMNKNGRYLILSDVRKDLLRVLNNSGVADYIENRNIFEDDKVNTTLSTAKALKRAKEHLGEIEPKVSIYYDQEKK